MWCLHTGVQVSSAAFCVMQTVAGGACNLHHLKCVQGGSPLRMHGWALAISHDALSSNFDSLMPSHQILSCCAHCDQEHTGRLCCGGHISQRGTGGSETAGTRPAQPCKESADVWLLKLQQWCMPQQMVVPQGMLWSGQTPGLATAVEVRVHESGGCQCPEKASPERLRLLALHA